MRVGADAGRRVLGGVVITPSGIQMVIVNHGGDAVEARLFPGEQPHTVAPEIVHKNKGVSGRGARI